MSRSQFQVQIIIFLSYLRHQYPYLLITFFSFYRRVLEYYDTTLAEKYTECEKMIEEQEVNKKHLDNMELAFSDLHT